MVTAPTGQQGRVRAGGGEGSGGGGRVGAARREHKWGPRGSTAPRNSQSAQRPMEGETQGQWPRRAGDSAHQRLSRGSARTQSQVSGTLRQVCRLAHLTQSFRPAGWPTLSPKEVSAGMTLVTGSCSAGENQGLCPPHTHPPSPAQGTTVEGPKPGQPPQALPCTGRWPHGNGLGSREAAQPSLG